MLSSKQQIDLIVINSRSAEDGAIEEARRSEHSKVETYSLLDRFSWYQERIWLDEPALILETQHGALASFNQLVLAYQDSVFNVALRILGDVELASDATQEAFISAFCSINGYRGGSFKAWLMRIVTNACYDELRRQKRHPTLPLEPNAGDGDEIETPRWLADSNLSPEDKCEAAELTRAIQHCLDALPVDFRTVVVLVDLQGMNYSEAASATRVPLGTVKSRLARARLRMRGSLQEFSELLPADFCSKKDPRLCKAYCDDFETLDPYA